MILHMLLVESIIVLGCYFDPLLGMIEIIFGPAEMPDQTTFIICSMLLCNIHTRYVNTSQPVTGICNDSVYRHPRLNYEFKICLKYVHFNYVNLIERARLLMNLHEGDTLHDLAC